MVAETYLFSWSRAMPWIFRKSLAFQPKSKPPTGDQGRTCATSNIFHRCQPGRSWKRLPLIESDRLARGSENSDCRTHLSQTGKSSWIPVSGAVAARRACWAPTEALAFCRACVPIPSGASATRACADICRSAWRPSHHSARHCDSSCHQRASNSRFECVAAAASPTDRLGLPPSLATGLRLAQQVPDSRTE